MSILPLSCPAVRRHHGVVQTPHGTATLLLIDSESPHRLQASANRRWTRLAARVLASSLDRQLAEGRQPESSRLLAARAHVLVAPPMRTELAGHLTRVAARSQMAPALRSPKVRLNRSSIVACEPVLQQALDALVAPRPTLARGIAIISTLLSDGTGPLYNTRRADELHDTLSEAILQL